LWQEKSTAYWRRHCASAKQQNVAPGKISQTPRSHLNCGERSFCKEADELWLVAKAKSGHEDAFGELYKRHRVKAHRTALRILRNQQDAEDAVQRAFQRALVNLERFREDSTFSTWLTRIAINEALMLLRQRRTREPLFHLRENLRIIVLHRDLKGLTSAETAKLLGLTVSTVKARTFRARKFLRKHLERKPLGAGLLASQRKRKA